MISSLKSRFEFAPRRALFLSAHKAAIYHWRGGDLGTSFLFDANKEGREYFARYLKETPKNPIYVIADVFEEEFKPETIPHVYGPDRLAIVTRKKSRLFRDTPYFQFTMQGREAEGRRDDKILLSAITNPGILKPWLALMEEHKVPVASVTSVPLFTAMLVKLLPEQSDNMLILSLQSISGFRQTFIHKGMFRVSRLVQMPRYGTEPYAPRIREEVEKIRRYLSSLRLSSPDEPLSVYFLVTGDLLTELRRAYRDSGVNRYHVLDINELMKAAGSTHRVATPFSDQLVVHQVLKNRPANRYGSDSDRRYYTMRTLRHSMLALSVMMILGGLAWSGANFMEGLGYKQSSLASQSKMEFYSVRYQIARERLPHTPVEPEDLKTAVDLADTLYKFKANPVTLLRTVSSGLRGFPKLQLDNVDWFASVNPEDSVTKQKHDDAGARKQKVVAPPVQDAPTYDYYQIAEIRGRIDQFDGNFRDAIDTVNKFAEALRGMQSVFSVEILALPLDISSNAVLQGNDQGSSSEAEFALRIVVGVNNEA